MCFNFEYNGRVHTKMPTAKIQLTKYGCANAFYTLMSSRHTHTHTLRKNTKSDSKT